MKKIIFLIALFAVAVPAFAQDDWHSNRHMAVTITVGHPLASGLWAGGRWLGMDIGFEYTLAPRTSIKVNFRYMHDVLFRVSLGGCWYPVRNCAGGIFFSGALQFQRTFGLAYQSWFGGIDTPSAYTGVLGNTFSFFAGVGNNVILPCHNNSRVAFIMETVLDFGWRIVNTSANSIYGWTHGTNGPRFRIPVGVTF